MCIWGKRQLFEPSSVGSFDLSIGKTCIIGHVEKVDKSDENDGKTSAPIRPHGHSKA